MVVVVVVVVVVRRRGLGRGRSIVPMQELPPRSARNAGRRQTLAHVQFSSVRFVCRRELAKFGQAFSSRQAGCFQNIQ